MAVEAKIVWSNTEPRLPKVPRKDRVKDGRHKIGTIQETPNGLRAHVVVGLPDLEGNTTRQLVQLTASPEIDISRDALEAMIREISEPLPAPGEKDQKVTIPRRGIAKYLPDRTVGTIHQSHGFALEDGVLKKKVRVHGDMHMGRDIDTDRPLLRRPQDRVIEVTAFDGHTRSRGDVPGAVTELHKEMGGIAQDEVRFTDTQAFPVRDGEQIIGAVRYGIVTYRTPEGKKAEYGAMIAYVKDPDGQFVPIDGTNIATRTKGGTGKKSKGLDEDLRKAWEKLTERVYEEYDGPREPITQEMEKVYSEPAFGIHRGGRTYQQDSIGFGGKVIIADIGGPESNPNERLVGLAKALVPSGDPKEMQKKIQEINSLEKEFLELRKQGKIQKIGVLADGVGGALNGEVASSIAVYVFQRKLVDLLKASIQQNPNMQELVWQALEAANAAVYAYNPGSWDNHPQTALAAYVVAPDNNVTFVKIADSRFYVKRGNSVVRILGDDSVVEDLLYGPKSFEGEPKVYDQIRPSEVFSHPKKNLITKAVGIYETLEAMESLRGKIKIRTVQLLPGDEIIATSDGGWAGINLNDQSVQDALAAGDQEMQDRMKEFTDQGDDLKVAIEKASHWAFGKAFQEMFLSPDKPNDPQSLADRLTTGRAEHDNPDNATALIETIR